MNYRVLIPVFALVLFAGGNSLAQERPGPITPPPGAKVVRIPAKQPEATPPAPAEELIQKFSQVDERLLHAFAGYTYRKTIRVQEFLGGDGSGGDFKITTQSYVTPDGKYYEKIVEQPPSTLRSLQLDPEDLEMLVRIPQFPLVPEQLDNYEIQYIGEQQVDELKTYAFRVQPKELKRSQALFDGLIWVDEQDMAIVKSYGRWVTETGDIATEHFPFSTFETYRENIVGQDWFPTYMRSEDTIPSKSGDVRLRLTVRWLDYQPTPGAKAAPTTPEPAPAQGTPAPKPPGRAAHVQ